MATSYTPGFTGFQYGRFSSMNQRAIGKFTDRNHLYTLSKTAPADYDKRVIQIYTQSALISNDFYNMLSQSTPYFIPRGETWKWNIEVPFSYTKIVDVPSTTLSQSKVGIDGQPFEIVLDSNEFSSNETIVVGHRIYGPQFAIISDPVPQGTAYLYKCTLLSDNPQSEYVDKQWLSVGLDVKSGTSVLGEFSQKMPGLGKGADSIEMFETLSSSYGRSHTITKMADEIQLDGKTLPMSRDSQGNLLDLVAYVPQLRNSTTKIGPSGVRWEPYVEQLLRKKMVSDKVFRAIHGRAGVTRDEGNKYEYKKLSDGVIQRMRKHGNYVPYNRGEFSNTLLRTVFGDLFYGRVSMQDRHVKLYTNEAGFDVFQTAAKQDAQNSGLTLTTNVQAIQSKGIKVSDPSQHLVYGWAFDSTFSRETGLIELIHLQELEERQLNVEFGQNKKATPIFLAFNVSPDSDGTFKGNIREVRLKGAPNMTWGYVDGRQHHLGHAASQGMSSANMFPGYQIWFEDRCDVFIEDLSRTVMIEEIPQF